MRSATESQAPTLDHAREGAGQNALGWVGVERLGAVMEAGAWGAPPRPAQTQDQCVSNLGASGNLVPSRSSETE